MLLSEGANRGRPYQESQTATGKQKDPYYFTFFNEKNEEKRDGTVESPDHSRIQSKLSDKRRDTSDSGSRRPAPPRQRLSELFKESLLKTEASRTEHSKENFEAQQKTIPTKPQLKVKSKLKLEKKLFAPGPSQTSTVNS